MPEVQMRPPVVTTQARSAESVAQASSPVQRRPATTARRGEPASTRGPVSVGEPVSVRGPVSVGEPVSVGTEPVSTGPASTGVLEVLSPHAEVVQARMIASQPLFRFNGASCRCTEIKIAPT
jgi:hypothetical protein